MKVLNVVGARPNFMKISPLHQAFMENGEFDSKIVHTGQHYDEKMSDLFFRQLELPKPDVYLEVGSGTHAQQTSRIIMEFEKVVLEEKPDLVVVVGDVNSTMACSLVACKLNVSVAHVEAGLRSGDRSMPEEINRIVTDSISDFLFVSEQSGLENLKMEGIPDEKVFLVGNVMIDSLVKFHEKAGKTSIMAELELQPSEFILMTMHRPVNVDKREGLEELLSILESITILQKVVFPVHPRTLKQLETFQLSQRFTQIPNLLIIDPLGYLEFLKLMENASVVITDSGGIQEETTYLRVPCLTLRDTTERPITITLGTNELMPLKASLLEKRIQKIFLGQRKTGHIPYLWDGNAAKRIVDILVNFS